MAGELENAFCAVRPPGHHACRDKAMGFCFFNNVAIAAKYALERHGLERVAIIDFDVHHGNGTEDIVAGDERILMCSFFQHPFYPEGGAQSDASNLVNVPVPAYTKGMEIRELIDCTGCRAWSSTGRNDLHQRRFRRPPRGRHGPAGPGRAGLHLDHERSSRWPAAMRRAAS
jgi:acetoin utilization deacetylase AcuC-like enzyme